MTPRRRHPTGCYDCGDTEAELWGPMDAGRCRPCEKARRAGTTDTLAETVRRYEATKAAHMEAMKRTDAARSAEKAALERRLRAETDLGANFPDAEVAR